MTKGAQIAFATVAAFGALVWVIASGSAGQGTFRYYQSVGDYHQAAPAQDGGSLRVHGFVVAGSIARDLNAGHVDFAIADAGSEGTVPVRFLGIDVPDLFRDGAEVVVEGRVEGRTFLAERVLAKCPSKYEVDPETQA